MPLLTHNCHAPYSVNWKELVNGLYLSTEGKQQLCKYCSVGLNKLSRHNIAAATTTTISHDRFRPLHQGASQVSLVKTLWKCGRSKQGYVSFSIKHTTEETQSMKMGPRDLQFDSVSGCQTQSHISSAIHITPHCPAWLHSY